MSFENAEQNLKEFLDELHLEGFEFDQNNTCIFVVDNEFSLHVTYVPVNDRLIIYSPLLDEIPSDEKNKIQLFETLLHGSALGVDMAGASAAVIPEENIVIMQYGIDMGQATSSSLTAIAPLFLATVKRWRQYCQEISEGLHLVPVSKNVRTDKPGGGSIRI